MIDVRRLARGLALQALYEIDSTDKESQEVIYFRDASALVDKDARLLAYLVLRAYHADGEEAKDEDDPALETAPPENLLAPKEQELALKLVKGVLRNRQQLDAMIHRYAPEWPIDQMAIIDRNILRISIYEFGISLDTPIKVAINEAVELAKIFGSDTAPSFINGVLASLANRYDEIQDDLDDSRKPE